MSEKPKSCCNIENFTTGEKCLLIHILTTFIGIIILIIIFLLHILIVRHSPHTRFAISINRSDFPWNEHEYIPLGVVFLNLTHATKPLCNSLLLRGKWSLVPGHCAALRSDPQLSAELPYWSIRYMWRNSNNSVTTLIKRSIPHPHFDRDIYINNIGLLEHMTFIFSYSFVPTGISLSIPEEPFRQSRYLQIIGWDWIHMKHGAPLKIGQTPNKTCGDTVSSISGELRSYEFCVTHIGNALACFDHGALVLLNSQVVGLFSWGEKCLDMDGSPFVIIEISAFQNWFEDIIIEYQDLNKNY